MDQSKITAQQLITLVEQSELDQTIKDIFIRDIRSEGVNEFMIEQVIAYCDKALEILDQKIKDAGA